MPPTGGPTIDGAGPPACVQKHHSRMMTGVFIAGLDPSATLALVARTSGVADRFPGLLQGLFLVSRVSHTVFTADDDGAVTCGDCLLTTITDTRQHLVTQRCRRSPEPSTPRSPLLYLPVRWCFRYRAHFGGPGSPGA